MTFDENGSAATTLVKYDAACLAIAVAVSVDEAKNWANKGAAMAAYARQAKNLELEAQSIEIRQRAKRRIGELSVKLEKARPGRKHNTSRIREVNPKAAALAAAGISTSEANRCEKIAAKPVAEFEAEIKAHKARITKRTHVSHNSVNDEWFTPPEYIAAAKAVMGGIDLDPASSLKANNKIVGAAQFFSPKEDGLSRDWNGRVWMNPPYSKDLVIKFSIKLIEQLEMRSVSQAIVLVNNATETCWFQSILKLASAVCFPKGRLKFIGQDMLPSGSPLQGQAILYFGMKQVPLVKFKKVFGEFGIVLCRVE